MLALSVRVEILVQKAATVWNKHFKTCIGLAGCQNI